MDSNSSGIDKAIKELSDSITELSSNKKENKTNSNLNKQLYTDSEICLLESMKNKNNKDSKKINKNSVKDMINNLKSLIDNNSIAKLLASSQNLNSNDMMNYKPSNSTNIDKQENNIEQIYKLSNLCNENDIYFNSDSDSFKNVMSSQKNITKIQLSNPNNVSGIISIKCCLDPEEMEQNTEEIYPLTDSFLNKVVTFNKENGDISYIADEYSINIPKDMDLEEAFKTLIIENINIRVYSKDIEEELKEVIKTNEMLEKENNEIELKMKKDANSKNEIFNENENMTNQTVTKLNDLKLNMMTILSNYISKLNSINEGIFSDNGIEKYYEAFEDMLNEVTKLNDNISTTLLQNSIEKSIKENIEFEFFKYKNNYSFSVNEYNNRINELKHNIISLKKEKEVLINENKNLKYTNLSIESDIGGSKSVDTRSVNSVLSDNQEIKSLYEVGSESSIKSSKFSKLTNSAKKIIRNTSNKKLFKDKKTRSRGFSVSLPVKHLDRNKDETNKRRNSIIDTSNEVIIPHVFIPHSYIKPTKCEICQELCWRKEIRCKTCGYRCHERCQNLAEKTSSCIVNNVQKNMISEMESQMKLFGTTISTYGINEIDFIPSIVKLCINEVEKRGMQTVGIYRKSGNVIKTRNLVNSFDRGEIPDISEEGEYPDIAVITSTLKQYFRDLPDALIPERFFNSIKEIIDIDDESEQINKMKELVEKLPKTNYETLKFLCNHLNKVDANSDINLMTSKNLGVVFGPTLIGESEKKSGNNMISTVSRVRAIDLLIRFSKEIFKFVPEKEKNHIGLDLLNDVKKSLNTKQTNIDEDEMDIHERNIDNYKKNSTSFSTIPQL